MAHLNDRQKAELGANTRTGCHGHALRNTPALQYGPCNAGRLGYGKKWEDSSRGHLQPR